MFTRFNLINILLNKQVVIVDDNDLSVFFSYFRPVVYKLISQVPVPFSDCRNVHYIDLSINANTVIRCNKKPELSKQHKREHDTITFRIVLKIISIVLRLKLYNFSIIWRNGSIELNRKLFYALRLNNISWKCRKMWVLFQLAYCGVTFKYGNESKLPAIIKITLWYYNFS